MVKHSERSRIYNPYFDEDIASPSVLRSDPMNGLNNHTIVEKRMTQLVKDYYQGLQTKKHTRQQAKRQEEKIANVVYQNFQEGGLVQMRDIYIANQVGTQGAHSGNSSTITQTIENNALDIDYQVLTQELDRIKNHLKSSDGNDETDILIGDIARATIAIKENRKQDVISILKSAGQKLYDIAKSIGCTIIAKMLTNEMGL